MRHAIKTGFSFGLTSGVITTLGLIVGLNSVTHSKLVVLAGILTIAIADSLSDALGIHMSEESENKHESKTIWLSTFSTFFFKLIFASSFLIFVLLLPLSEAISVSIIWGLFLISSLSYHLAKKQHKRPDKVIMEHLIIATIVIISTNFIGTFISNLN